MAMLLKIGWFPMSLIAIFFCPLFLFCVFIYALYKIGFTRLSHLYIVLIGTEEEVMKLDKTQGGLYDFTGSRVCFSKAEKRAEKFVATGSIEE